MKTVLGGPAQSGKSCLRAGLKYALCAIPGAPYPLFIPGCPDGEGAWFTETAARDPQLARALKEAYKAKFTPEFAQWKATEVAGLSVPFAFIDIGGKVTEENRTICRPATHVILLAGNSPKDGTPWQERLVPWWAFCRELGLTVVAEIFSDYHGTEDTVQGVGADGVFRGSVHHLDRSEDPNEVAKRPCIVALAEYLVSLVRQEIGQ